MNTQQLPTIECRETDAAACTAALADQVFDNLRDQYGDITRALIEHAVSETLYAISFALRRGEPLSVEAIGQFIPSLIGNDRVIRFRAADSLFLPLPSGMPPLIRIIDRRQHPQETCA